MPKPGERWLLVTSAYHMPRSIGLFRKAGFAVEAYPVDWQVGRQEDLLSTDVVSSDGLHLVNTGVREWMGLIAYRLAAGTDALLPGPELRASQSPQRAIRLESLETSPAATPIWEFTPCNSNHRRNNSIWPPWWPI